MTQINSILPIFPYSDPYQIKSVLEDSDLSKPFSDSFVLPENNNEEDSFSSAARDDFSNLVDRATNQLRPLANDNGIISKASDLLNPFLEQDDGYVDEFAKLFQEKKAAKLWQESLERRLSSQIDRLMGVTMVKQSIKLAACLSA